VRTGVKVMGIMGQERVEGIEVLDSIEDKRETLKVDGVLVQIGFNANTDFLNEMIPLDEKQQIIVNEKMETSLPYLLAAGDIRSGSSGQVATAVGDGAMAAMSAIRYLQTRE
jgi:thioredoxin reductase (NADPH)